MFNDLISLVGQMPQSEKNLQERVTGRRKKLIELIGEHYPDKKGTIFLFAPIEHDHATFIQDSSFFYFSEISEPAAVVSFGFYDPVTLYQPNFGDLRSKWVQPVDVINEETKILYGIDVLKHSGAVLGTYTVDPYFSQTDYQQVIQDLLQTIAQGKVIFTLYPQHSRAYAQVKNIVDRLSLFVPNLMQHIVDISPLVAKLRRKKDISEIEKMYQAIGITEAAFQAAAHMLRPDCKEAEIQAAMEYIFTENHATRAYPSIVAGGKRATVLHYNLNMKFPFLILSPTTQTTTPPFFVIRNNSLAIFSVINEPFVEILHFMPLSTAFFNICNISFLENGSPPEKYISSTPYSFISSKALIKKS